MKTRREGGKVSEDLSTFLKIIKEAMFGVDRNFGKGLKLFFFFATTIFQNISIVFSTFIKQILYICLSFFKVDLRRKRFINKRSKRSNLNLFDSKSLLCHDRFPKSKIVDRIFCHGHRVNIKNMLAPFFNVPLPSRRYFTYFRARI